MADTSDMSDTDTAQATAATDEHHDVGHGHEAGGDQLGPADLRAWGVAIAGGGVGVLVALVLYLASTS